jgi:hypothetical protein
MRLPQMTSRRWMATAAAVALVLGGFIGTTDLERRAVHYNREAAHHRFLEDHLRGSADYLELLARDPARSYELLNAITKAGKRWQERAAAARFELMERQSGTPGEQWYPEARDLATRLAKGYRQESEYHGRQKLRYERAALDPWNHVAPEPANPE